MGHALMTSEILVVTSTAHVRSAKKIILPTFVLTEVCEPGDDGAQRHSVFVGSTETVYYVRPKLADTGQRVDGKSKWKPSQFNLYPIVQEASGLPWPEASIYLMSRLENTPDLSMSTYDGIAEDLAAYRRFLDEEDIDWRHFPAQKLSRPTYRYRSHLMRAVEAKTLAASSAKRRMSSIIAFYTWMKADGLLIPANAPWRESDVYIKLTGVHGFEFTKHVTTTDISIKLPKQDDPYEGTIDDGGKLRPLPKVEQRWVMEALVARGNTEMTLVHLLALVTGARIQTVLTFRLGHIQRWTQEQLQSPLAGEIRFSVGPGTGIDTKRNKSLSLHIPVWLCRVLHTYAHSERARLRRIAAKGGDVAEQYLFLSRYGSPFYQSRKDSRTFDATSKSRQPIKGQSVRKFMGEVVIPYVRAKHDSKFHYQFHDLRASFGMNLTDSQLKLVEQGKRTLSQVREFVKVRMGHQSAAITDNYLQFRGNIAHILHVSDDHDEYLMELTANAGL